MFFGKNEFLDRAAKKIQMEKRFPEEDFEYALYPSFGHFPGDFEYALYPSFGHFPGDFEYALYPSFGRNKGKLIGHINGKKVYRKKDKDGKLKNVYGNGKKINRNAKIIKI